MRYIQVIRLRSSGRNLVPEYTLNIRFGTGHGVKIIADTHDLHGGIQSIAEVCHDIGRKLDRPLLAVDVSTMTCAYIPVVVVVNPHIEVVRFERLYGSPCPIKRGELLFNDGHVGPHEHSAIEGCDSSGQLQGLDQHLHSARWPPAGKGKEDTR